MQITKLNLKQLISYWTNKNTIKDIPLNQVRILFIKFKFIYKQSNKDFIWKADIKQETMISLLKFVVESISIIKLTVCYIKNAISF